MSLALRNPRLLALIALIALTFLAVVSVLLSAVGHVPVLHMVGAALHPYLQYGHG